MPYREEELPNLLRIAQAIRTLLEGYDNATQSYQNYQLANLKMMCRWLEKFMDANVSRAAAEMSLQNGIDVSRLCRAKWSQQSTLPKDPQRQKFHLEHIVPVNQLASQILKERNGTSDLIASLLASADIAWITKCEDRRLTELGYRSTRSDPLQAYKDAGIEFITGKFV